MKKHLKRLAAHRTQQIHRKENTWTIKASPGPHPLTRSLPLGIIVREYLRLSDNYREAKRVIAQSDILVDGIPRKNHKFPCGLMDVISIPKLQNSYRILFNQKGKLTPVKISEKDAEWKLLRVQNKSNIRKGKTQLNLHDGKNLIVAKDEYRTGDVIRFSFAKKKIEDSYKFQKGTIALVTGGRHIGEIANINEIHSIHSTKSNLVSLSNDKEFQTLSEYIFPIGKTKSVITLPEVKMQ